MHGLRDHLRERIDRHILAQKTFQHAGDQEHTGANLVLFIKGDSDLDPCGEPSRARGADAANDLPAGEPGEPIDQEPINRRLLCVQLRVGVIVQPQDLLQGVQTIFGVGKREVVQRQG